MKLNFAIICLGLWLLVHPSAAEMQANVRFINNDQLSGRLESLSTDRLVWKSPILESPASFFLKSVLDLSLPAGPRQQAARYEALLALTNGDSVSGQLVSISDEVIELDTWFAGRMKFRRVMVESVSINERPVYLYQGPKGIEEWTATGNPPAWSYKNAALISNTAGSIAKEINLPDACSITFDAAWRGALGLKLILFSDNIKSDNPSNGYEVSFHQKAIYARSCKTGATLGPGAIAPALQENEKAKIEVRSSLKDGTLVVLVNGEVVGAWKDPEMAQNEHGRGIHFLTINASPVRIAQIGVAAWDGVVDKMPMPRMAGGFRQFEFQEEDQESVQPPAENKENRMVLRNGDSIAGEVLGIAEDMITIKTPFREVKVPLEVLKSVALKPVDLERCKRENGDVRAWFTDGTSLVFRLESYAGATITGYNQNFGTAEFEIAAFNRIEFNIYDRKLDDLRVVNQW